MSEQKRFSHSQMKKSRHYIVGWIIFKEIISEGLGFLLCNLLSGKTRTKVVNSIEGPERKAKM